MARNLILAVFFALCCFSANGKVLDTERASILNEILPSANTCVLDVNAILSLYFLKACPGRCDICDDLAAVSEPITDIGNPDRNKLTEELVTIYCIKKYV